MVQLRALEPEDIDFLYNLENDRTLWEVSETQAPFSRQLLLSYIANAHQDIYQAKQQRFVITYQEKAVGCADLYDYQPKNKRSYSRCRSFQAKRNCYQGLGRTMFLCLYFLRLTPAYRLCTSGKSL